VAELSQNLDTLAAELGGCELFIFTSGTGELNPALDFALEHPTLETNVIGFTAAVDWAYGRF
jgi:hypothetical protein